MLRRASVLTISAVLLVAAPVASAAEATPLPAPTLVTPSGPATLQNVWTGAVPAIGYGPSVIVGWSVTVGPGSNAGPVRLQNLDYEGGHPVVRGGAPAEMLPAAPGTYTFAIPPGQGLRATSGGGPSPLLTQEVGGHAILENVPSTPELGPMADAAQLSHVDIFAPPVADGATDLGIAARRIDARRLALSIVTEPDRDEDGLGDTTQDTGDLKLLSARVVGRTALGLEVVTRVRNVGSTTRDRPSLAIDGTGMWITCTAGCDEPLAPGGEVDLHGRVRTANGIAPAADPQQLSVAAEGPDTHPADNTMALAPLVRLSAPPAAGSPAGGLRVRVGLSHAGTVKLAARVAGVGFTRTVTLTAASRQTILLAPARRADRRRLARALRRPGALKAIVTADAGGGATAALRLKV